ncbi:glycosyltransferase family 4 protein [Leuconostoc citreum]|uniref:glycosyltransferase family 4 protein n=1 Tax=Leuconostoc citreum TaxID=33964 RepID=UPI000C288B75|nr:glycosyltransferase family 4 protein [Leuconostoc citreum]
MNSNFQKIKILYLHAGAELYGADKILLELLSGIDKKKFEPIVLLPNDGPLVDKISRLGVKVNILKYPILRRKIFTPLGIIKYVYNYIRYSFKISSFVRKNNIDILHVNTAAVLEGAFIKLFNKKPIVWHIHEIIESPEIVFQFTSLMIQRFSNIIVTVSNATKKRLLDSSIIDSNKVRTIHNGININAVVNENRDEVKERMEGKLNIPKGTKIVGMIGRINSWKGQHDFVQAINLAFSKNKNIHAVIVGGIFEGEEHFLDELNKNIAETVDPSRIHLVNFSENIADFYSLFDIFVLPSTQPDPFPTVVLEAMANELPIVGYNHGGIKEMLENNISGYLVEVKNIVKLGDCILNLVNNDELSVSVGKAAENRQSTLFSNKSFIQKFEAAYSEASSIG